ncbi:3'-5' exonuclease [Gonapodya sp. JEL0774]|nr:3'-5' exonuclease [Gonapodya sp. JEL0774]
MSKKPMIPAVSSNWKKLSSKLATIDTRRKRRNPPIEESSPSVKRIRLDNRRNKANSQVNPPPVPSFPRGSNFSHRPAAPIHRAPAIPSTLPISGSSSGMSSSELPSTVGEWFTKLNTEEVNTVKGNDRVGKYLAIDCEMVGVGPDGSRSMLARVSIVNYHGFCVMDEFVEPMERVTDYRTAVSGITPELLQNAKPFKVVQNRVAELLTGRILVGHSLRNDLDCLLLSHPHRDVKDTSQFAPFRKMAKGRSPALRRLAKDILGLDIQGGQHSSVEDARVAMLLYRSFKSDWDHSLPPSS